MRRSGLVLVLALALTPSATSRAQPVAPDPADVQFREGNAAYHQGRFAEARASYVAAFRIKQTHDIAANLGFAEVKLEQWREAAKHLAFALRNWAPTGKVDSKESAAHWLGLAKQQIVTLTITVDAGAEVLLDGKPVATTAGEELFVDPGTHTVGARRDGYAPAEQTVQAEKGKAFPVTLVLAPSATATPSAPPPIRPPKAVVVASGVLAAVGLGAGIGLTVAANGKSADAGSMRVGLGGQRTACTATPTAACVTLKDTLRSESTLSRAAVGSYVAGSALAVAAVGMGLWHGRAPSGVKASASVRAGAAISADGARVTILGEW